MTFEEFENLSESIVKYLFRNTDAQVSQTRTTKDGGYDIEVEYNNENDVQRAYFECKLRNSNLSIRDIAANVIIAYNHGAVAMIALTNHDFTQQTGDELFKFSQQTILNIKIISGQDIQQLVLENDIPVSAELKEYFHFKKNHRKNKFKILQLNLEQDIPSQIFKQTKYLCDNKIDLFLKKIFYNEIIDIANSIESGKIIVVKGFLGVGKHQIIQSSIEMSKKRIIALDATFYNTKELVVLDLLSQIWGIPEIKILESFSKDNLESIVESIGNEKNNVDTVALLISLMNKEAEGKKATALQNVLLSQYIIKLLNLHVKNINYVFYLRNLQYSHKEIFDFLIFLSKYLRKNKIPCIISYQDPEYQLQYGKNILENLQHIDGYTEYEISPLTMEDAEEYIRESYPEISQHIAKLIVSRIGTRFYNLQSLLKGLLPNSSMLPTDSKIFINKLDMISPNNIENQVNLVLMQYQNTYPIFFQALFIFECRIPLEIVSLLGIESHILDSMEKIGLFYVEHGIVLARNSFVKDWIMHAYSRSNISIHLRAAELISRLDNLKNPYNTERILLLRIVENWKDALTLIDSDLAVVKRAKQYTLLKAELITAIDISVQLKDILKEAQYLVQLMELIAILKEIDSDESERRIKQLEKCVQYLKSYYKFNYALDFFKLKRAFKIGSYVEDNDISVKLGKQYYDECLLNNLTDNEGDWLGKICCCYALYIKSIEGNESSLQIFKNALKIFPSSFELQREYYSHIACMQLYANPIRAFARYEKILNMFKLNAPDSAALPFHEYGDLAMCQLLAHNFEYALILSNRAIEICESNGVNDEIGRNLNIRGCIYWCIGNLLEAEDDFREATSVMSSSGYLHYSWRSQINLLQIIQNTETYLDIKLEMLEKLYSDFKHLLCKKINSLAQTDLKSFQKTREYHALLVLGYLWEKIGEVNKGSLKICNDFKIGNHVTQYEKDLHNMQLGNIHFTDSPYIREDYIFFVG